MSTKEVVVELKTGERYGVSTAAQAAKLYPDAKIVSYGDGEPYEAPASPAPARKRTKAATGRNKTAATDPVTAPDVPVTTDQESGDDDADQI